MSPTDQSSAQARRLMKLRVPLICALGLNCLVVGWIPLASLGSGALAQASPSDRNPTAEATGAGNQQEDVDATPVIVIDDPLQTSDNVETADATPVETPQSDVEPTNVNDVEPTTVAVTPVPTTEPTVDATPADAPVDVTPTTTAKLGDVTTDNTEETGSFVELFGLGDQEDGNSGETLAAMPADDDIAPPEPKVERVAKGKTLVKNPKETRGTVHFLLNDELHALKAGESKVFAEKATIKFHRGGQHGSAEQLLLHGVYEFAVTRKTGWRLLRD